MPSFVEIALNQGFVARVSPRVLPLVSPHRWWTNKGGRAIYAVARIDGRIVQMHRLIAKAPDGLDVDHIDHDGLNNTDENLRICTRAQNCVRKRFRQPSRTGYRGVYVRPSGTFYAKINSHGRGTNPVYLGTFVCPIQAAQAYDRKAIEIYGEYAVLNYPCLQESAA